MNFDKITNIITEILKELNMKLYSIKFKNEFGAQILEILIDEENLSHDIIEPINNKIIEAVSDELPDSVFLEVSSVGLERPLNNIEEVKAHKGGFLHIVSDFYKGDAVLEDVKEDVLVIAANQKGRKVIKEIPYSKISKIRKAIKF
ncbi:conserved hypothetical protein (UPF0090) [Alteracholeplasma palmae J233]|uniref:Ribosome maturation factor RimP n=1 Tax=Alteracholeplasma palmae (strain ATCC 49389 / J233) TaxID=1318466 RepID=U4KKC3_ALTPJ|nr:ribosome assembly cofactor RimP [Alteracholeplasma palmae]CCV64027.1 conserved hypothetical protein (UPF0090) [Alteracholeplasma palmae J233]